MRAYMDMYLSESRTLLENFEASIQILRENQDTCNPDTLKTASRSVHTLASNSASMGFMSISKLAREIEYFLDELAKKKIALNDEMLDFLAECKKTLKNGLCSVEADKEEPDVSSQLDGIENLKKQI